MPNKKFDYQFEDIRREDTPVSTAGFGSVVEDPENPDEAFVEVDLDEEDLSKAVSVADTDADANASANGKDSPRKTGNDKRREALDARRTRQRTDQLQQDLDEGREEFATEVNSLKNEVAELKAGKEIDAIDAEFGSKEKDLTAEMTQAMEDGDSEKTAEINTKLIALNSEKQAKKAAAEASVSIIEDLDANRADNKPANERAVQFIRDNDEWWSDPDQDDAVDYARRLDKKLVVMGFNPESDAYWARFNHNFDKKFEGLRVADPDDIDIELDPGQDSGRSRRKSPVSQPGGAGAARRSVNNRGKNNDQGGSKVRLTAAHKANMVQFGLDPSNPEHCANYAKEVQATGARDERRAS